MQRAANKTNIIEVVSLTVNTTTHTTKCAFAFSFILNNVSRIKLYVIRKRVNTASCIGYITTDSSTVHDKGGLIGSLTALDTRINNTNGTSLTSAHCCVDGIVSRYKSVFTRFKSRVARNIHGHSSTFLSSPKSEL